VQAWEQLLLLNLIIFLYDIQRIPFDCIKEQTLKLRPKQKVFVQVFVDGAKANC
jgi:hypothetical protein